MNNDKNKNTHETSDSTSNHQLGMLGLLAVSAVIWKNEDKIRFWFYNNVLFVIFAVIGLLAILGFYLWHRIKKKEAEHFERRKSLRQVQSHRDVDDYYKRKGH